MENKFGPLIADNGKDTSPGVYNTRTENSRDDWETPDWLFKILHREFNFTLERVDCMMLFTSDPPKKMLQELSLWTKSECPYCKRAFDISKMNPISEICKRQKRLNSRRSTR